MLAVAAAPMVAAGVILSARNNNSPSSFPKGNSSIQSQITIDQASRKLQRKLLTLLHEDKPTANRLLEQAKRKNPNRAIDWYVDQVIYDLERDRGGY